MERIANLFITYLRKGNSVEDYLASTRLCSEFRRASLGRDVWHAFLSVEWTTAVISKQISDGTLSRCKVDELTEFLRACEGKISEEHAALLPGVISATFPLIRKVYPSYPLFVPRLVHSHVL